MQTVPIEVDYAKARQLYREYRKHLHSQPRAYQLLGQGRLIIRALESVKAAGVYAEGANAGFPKARALPRRRRRLHRAHRTPRRLHHAC